MEPRFIDKNEFTVVGAAARGQLGEFNYGEVWEKQYMPMDELLKPYSVDGGYYGVTLGEDDHLVYLAGMAVEGLPELPAGAEKRIIPAARYVVFDCSLSEIGDTWRTAYEKWLPASAYELDTAAVDFEFYPPNNGGNMPVQICIPVKAKEPVV